MTIVEILENKDKKKENKYLIILLPRDGLLASVLLLILCVCVLKFHPSFWKASLLDLFPLHLPRVFLIPCLPGLYSLLPEAVTS